MQTTVEVVEARSESRGRAALQQSPAILAAILDALPTGVALCGLDGRLPFANEAARRELEHGRALALRPPGLLVASDTSAQSRLREAVSAAIRLRRHQIVDASSPNRTLFVAVVPLPPAAGSASEALLLFSRQTVCSEPALHLLGQLFCLTHAERDVLGTLLSGCTVQQAAQLRGREISTLRAQLVAIRGKFRQRRVEHVLRQVALMPWPIENACFSPEATAERG